jgi:hypothetical protein
MPVYDNRTDPSAVGGVSPDPAASATPTPKRVERRSFNRLYLERTKQFAVSLKTNAEWMKQFLHAGN